MRRRTLLRSYWNSDVFQERTAISQFRFIVILIVIILLGSFTFSYPTYAAVIYSGNGSDLESLPSWFSLGTSQALFPNESAVPLSSDNTVTVNYDPSDLLITDPNNVFGGLSQFENVVNNRVEISNGWVNYRVYGGYSESGKTINNTVTVNNGHIGANIYGGQSDSGAVESNDVTVNDGTVAGNIYGGSSDSNNAEKNTVTIGGGSVIGAIYGGFSDSGNAGNNEVTVSGGSVGRYIYGGYSTLGDSANNAVTIDGGTVSFVYGGYSNWGNASNNTVTVSGGSVDRIFGGNSAWGDALDNTVVISGVTVTNQVHGGYSGQGVASGNTVSISNSSISGNVDGGEGYGVAVDNTVTISGGSVSGTIYGGQSSSSHATDNSVTISDSTVGSFVYGGYGNNGNALNNTVTISNSSVSDNVLGGFSINGDATYNTVTIAGSLLFSANAGILGGYVTSGGGDAFTGNTLNFKSSGVSAAGVGNFEYYNFYLPAGTAANDTMLSVTSTVYLAGTTAEVFLQGGISLQAGDRVSLINSTSGVNASPNNTGSTVLAGAFIAYDFDIYTDAYNLWAELAKASPTQQSGILTDSRLAPLAFLNQGADMLAALEYQEVSGDKRFNTFAVVGGGSSTYDTGAGAEIDIDGFSVLAGVMWQAPVKKNTLMLSAFFEAGWGSYDTFRDLGGGDAVRGSGDSDYYGAGLHMRYKWDSDTPGGLYAEASLRFGRNKSDFYTGDLAAVSNFSYDSSSNYYGAHVGLGYVWQLSGKTRLEAVSKYIWTRLDGDDVTASTGDRIHFDSLDSRRFRAGLRMYHDYGNANAVTLYYGAAYEYEFAGDADARLVGLSLDGSGMSGGSGIGELGVIFRPSKDNDRLMMQLGVQGYVGAREGVSGVLKFQYAF